MAVCLQENFLEGFAQLSSKFKTTTKKRVVVECWKEESKKQNAKDSHPRPLTLCASIFTLLSINFLTYTSISWGEEILKSLLVSNKA